MKCTAVLNIAGEHFDCDRDAPHDGWGHGNKAAQAIWTGTDKEPTKPLSGRVMPPGMPTIHG